MLPERIVKRIIGNLPKKVTIVVYSSNAMLEFIKKIATLSNSIEYEFVSDVEKTTSLPAIGFKNTQIFFHTIPKHLELEAFLNTIRMISEIERPKSLDVEVITFVSNFCPNCRSVVEALNRVALKMGAKHHIIDISLYPEVAKKASVESVPTIFIGKMIFRGPIDELDAERWIRAEVEKDYYEYIVYKLEKGEIDDLKSITSEVETIAELIAHRSFLVRLGAMALLEEIHKKEGKINKRAKEEIIRLLEHEDERIREDAAMMLGIVGEKEDISILESMLKDAKIAESAREAIENIKMRYGG
ncbi:MAG: thioredoxin family protein [Archaeoglobaceae archaeon]